MEDRNEKTIKEIIEYLKIQNGNCSNELSNVEGLCLVNYIEWLEYRINKAIEYIGNDIPYLETPDDDYENNHKMIEYDIKDLLGILKGSE